MRGLAISGAVLILAAIWAPLAAAGSDARALDLADRLEKAMGGRAAYEAHPFLTFRFIVEREGKQVADWFHAWDRATGRYRLEGVRDGKPFLVLMNLDTREGEVRLGGSRLDAEAAAPHLEFAYGRHINDSYWLLMPWKWRDPGVTLGYEGERTVDGGTYEVASLAFEQVGLTPNDRYWALVSRESGLLERWEFVLQQEDGSPGSAPPTVFAWEEWSDVGGGIRLSLRKTKLGEGPPFVIRFTEVRLADAADGALFTP